MSAFDKADLLYLRDTAEQQRHNELELRDSERNQFASLRSQLDKHHEDPRQGPAAVRPPKRDRDTNIRYGCIMPYVRHPARRMLAGWRPFIAIAQSVHVGKNPSNVPLMCRL